MSHTAFLFSGQGDQFPGMGQDLCERYPAAAEVFDLCESLRPGTRAQCFEGTAEELKETVNTQPCLFAVELAAAAVLAEKNVTAEAAAGFSLGEVAAAAFVGVCGIETGFRLVTKRGELMQAASEKCDTAMAAVLRLTDEQVEEICSRHQGIYPVNYNCPGQITVSGLAGEMPALTADVKEAGGRALPLKVKGAFHSPFMEEAAASFADVLVREDLKVPRIKLYSDLTAQPYHDDPVRLLSEQICHPVRWERLIRNMIADGIDTFIELGPGKTLTNMMKKIDRDVRAYTLADYLAEVETC